ncbi:MAG: response regulator transcription factor [Crocinitomicaceae bacterium]|nr:response regulator transcription factor [Crocinitomicaceae bacterium]
MLRIAIADDHALFRKSLKLLIGSFENMEIVAGASNGIELLEKLKTVTADILLLDLQMPEMDGFETCNKINELYPEMKILVLTLISEEDTIKKIMGMGVNGYFTKNTDPHELEKAIWKLEDNGFYFEKRLTTVIEKILKEQEKTNLEVTVQITDREMEIVRLAIKEFSGKEIADQLDISLKTVETHKRNLMEKTNSKNFIGVIIYVLSNRLIFIDELTRE